MSTGRVRFGWHWIDLVLYVLALVFLIPVVLKFVEEIADALE